MFPTDIHLGSNDHVRHHLIHFPDPVVRPGGMSFGTGHAPSFVPQADAERYYFEPDQMTLTLTPDSRRIKLGQPLTLSWELMNHTAYVIPTPKDVRRESLHAQVVIVDPNGITRTAPPATIVSDGGAIHGLAPGEKREAKTTLFYSSRGFAFRTPGAHSIKMQIVWDYGGIPFGVRAMADVWVDYPVTDADNEVAAAMMHPDVGAMVAMGGKAHHMPEVGGRVTAVLDQHPEHPVCKALAKLMAHRKGKAK
jgi:hypothetical protein